MFNNVMSAFVRGLDTCFVSVEADISEGMPVFDMIGYLSSEVKEARERVRTALKNSSIILPPKRITINLSPANVRKDGTYFDLAIATAVLASCGIIHSNLLSDCLIIGELSLNGMVNSVYGILPIVSAAQERGIKRCIVPYDNYNEASIVPGIEVIPVSSLKVLMDYFSGNKSKRDVHISIEETQIKEIHYNEDFSDISGQENLVRAAKIAVAGFHNLLIIGPPGAGKSMIARRLPSIMPEMTWAERIEISKIYSIMGLLPANQPLMEKRPFRSPHHTISAHAMAGGGLIPKPGEVTLAHKGVLFLDELPEFQKNTLEIMRQPLEEGIVHISRTRGSYDYPAHFMLVAAMNPCRCGYFPDYNKCTCSPDDVRRYLSKISRPLLDRIDMCVEAGQVSFDELNDKKKVCDSESIRVQIERTRKIQLERYKNMNIQFNSQLSGDEINKYCYLGRKEERYIRDIYEKMDLTARGYHRILKVARTIADFDGKESIGMEHICEAVSYRMIDKKYWTR